MTGALRQHPGDHATWTPRPGGSPAGTPARTAGSARGYRAILLLLYVAGFATWTWAGLNQDVGWLLHVADRLHAGARLYVDIHEVNPPLVVWLMAIPAALARATGMSQLLAVNLFALAVVAGGGFLTAMVVGRLPGLTKRAGRTVVVALVAVAMLFPGADVAQREHLIVPLVAPYLCLVAAVLAGARLPTPLRVAAGAWAAVGFSLKPHYVLVWALIELALMIRQRSVRTVLRPEAGTVMVLGALYGASLLRFASVYLEFARSWGGLYLDFNRRPWTELLRTPEVLLVVAACGIVGLARDRSAIRWLQVVLGGAALAFTLAFLAQEKGWTYHRLPMISFAAMVLSISVIGHSASAGAPKLARPGQLLRVTALSGGLAMLALQLRAAIPIIISRRAFASDLASITEERGAAVRLLALTPGIAPAFPFVNYTGAEWASRDAHAWALWTFYRRTCDPSSQRPLVGEDSALLARAIRTTERELTQAAPDVVVVYDGGYGQNGPDSCATFYRFVRRDPVLARALDRLVLRARVRDFVVFTVH